MGKIKVCGMRHKENIQEIALLEPDLMGFIFYKKSARYAGDLLKPEYLQSIPENIKKVGVFVNAPLHEVIDTIKKYNFDFAQLHGDESPFYCKEAFENEIRIIKAFQVDNDFDFEMTAAYTPFCEYFLFDTKSDQYGGTGKTFDWKKLEEYNGEVPFLLSGGIQPEHAAEIKRLKLPMLFGVDINSKFEIEPGLKNAEKVKSFLGQIRA